MKGKKIFTSTEAATIKSLIRKKLVADAATQKKIRNQIRSLGFYITDFSNKKRYTVRDFEAVIKIQD